MQIACLESKGSVVSPHSTGFVMCLHALTPHPTTCTHPSNTRGDGPTLNNFHSGLTDPWQHPLLPSHSTGRDSEEGESVWGRVCDRVKVRGWELISEESWWCLRFVWPHGLTLCVRTATDTNQTYIMEVFLRRLNSTDNVWIKHPRKTGSKKSCQWE